MTLHQLLPFMPTARASGPMEAEVSGVTADSRRVTAGALFFAHRGTKVDGHEYIPQALEQGAVGIIAELPVPPDYLGAWIEVKDAPLAMGSVASAVHGEPSLKLQVAGVTGTNGKTTVAFLIQHLIVQSKGRCGMLGTIRYDLGNDEILPATHTTPDSAEMHRLLAAILGNGCAGVAMEVSSHAVDQQRIAGIEFDAAVFTNLTQDHLDYHRSMDAYFEAKAAFFEHLVHQKAKRHPCMVINIDDPAGKKLADRYQEKASVTTYGMSYAADFRITDLTNTISTTQFHLLVGGRSLLVRLPLIGRFNVFNAVAALAAVHGMGYNLREAVQHLSAAPQVPGRLQSVGSQRNFRVFVDYAHTPDAMENVLRTLKALNPRRIITVFGCGGDRDVTKRPLMGSIAENLSDHVILTSDNPRSEDPEKILDEIQQGLRGSAHTKIVDRAQAIALAIEVARDGDIILIAGKGHEDYQIFADRTITFDDVKVASRCLRDKKTAQDT